MSQDVKIQMRIEFLNFEFENSENLNQSLELKNYDQFSSLQKVVVVGDVTSLKDILRNRNNAPFDLASFRVFTEDRMCSELIDFWCSVEAFRTIIDLETHEKQAKYIYETYISQQAPKEINISEQVRRTIHQKLFDITETLDTSIFDESQQETETLLLGNIYPKFINHVHLRRELLLSRNIAMWCFNPPTIRGFFTFPNPINNVESRIHNICVIFLVSISVILARFYNFPFLFFYIFYGYTARVFTGPRLDPQAFLVLFVFRPLLEDKIPLFKSHYESSIPKHFAQICGMLFSGLGTLFWFLNMRIISLIFWILLFIAAFLAGIFNYCIACEIIYYGAKAGWLPKSWYDDCTMTYITGENHRKSLSFLFLCLNMGETLSKLAVDTASFLLGTQVADTLLPIASIAYGTQFLAFLVAAPLHTEKLLYFPLPLIHQRKVPLILVIFPQTFEPFKIKLNLYGMRNSFLIKTMETTSSGLSLTIIWSIRLGTFLFWRILKDGEDSRFKKIKHQVAIFFVLWMGQALWNVVTAIAVYTVNSLPKEIHPDLGFLDYIGIAIWVIGFAVEVIADFQKSSFRSKPENKRKFINHGLWRLSRHPNYFGDVTLWIGTTLLCTPALIKVSHSHPHLIKPLFAYSTCLAPAFLYSQLSYASGVTILEAQGEKRWGSSAEYKAYIKNTNRFFPWWPRSIKVKDQ
ncbi:hypothetical protein G9A89_008469 [Geosiphon pyriformis]|nr:hypothetical protein G9A89_008469 [Geosiphon pyriformis]